MVKIVLILLVLAAGAGLALLAGRDGGYLLLAWNGWRVEINNLVVAVGLLLGLFLGLHWLINMAAAMRRGHGHWQQRRILRRDRSGQRALLAGLLCLAEGRWASAEKKLRRSVGLSKTPLLGLLGAAQAADGQDDYDGRDRYLATASRCTPTSVVAVGLQRARYLVSDGQIEQAIHALQRLLEVEPRHPLVLGQLHALYAQSENWQGLLDLLPQLRKQKLVDPAAAEALTRKCHLQLLKTADNLVEAWRHLPKKYAHDGEMLGLYLQVLIAEGQADRAIALLQRELNRGLHDGLLELYGSIPAEDSTRQLEQVEKWLQHSPTHPMLLRVAGRIAARADLRDRAVTYYEALTATHADPLACNELAKLYLLQQQPEMALKSLQRGLELAL